MQSSKGQLPSLYQLTSNNQTLRIPASPLQKLRVIKKKQKLQVEKTAIPPALPQQQQKTQNEQKEENKRNISKTSEQKSKSRGRHSRSRDKRRRLPKTKKAKDNGKKQIPQQVNQIKRSLIGIQDEYTNSKQNQQAMLVKQSNKSQPPKSQKQQQQQNPFLHQGASNLPAFNSKQYAKPALSQFYEHHITNNTLGAVQSVAQLAKEDHSNIPQLQSHFQPVVYETWQLQTQQPKQKNQPIYVTPSYPISNNIPQILSTHVHSNNPYKINSNINIDSHRGNRQTKGKNQSNSIGDKERYIKTKICYQFLRGRCKKQASQCNYAHGQEDMRYPRRSNNLCRNYQRGLCKKPQNQCRFTHADGKKWYQSRSPSSQSQKKMKESIKTQQSSKPNEPKVEEFPNPYEVNQVQNINEAYMTKISQIPQIPVIPQMQQIPQNPQIPPIQNFAYGYYQPYPIPQNYDNKNEINAGFNSSNLYGYPSNYPFPMFHPGLYPYYGGYPYGTSNSLQNNVSMGQMSYPHYPVSAQGVNNSYSSNQGASPQYSDCQQPVLYAGGHGQPGFEGKQDGNHGNYGHRDKQGGRQRFKEERDRKYEKYGRR